MTIQYSIRPVTRYIITRYEEGESGSARNVGKGEYDNADIAYEVAYALAKTEHERIGSPIDSESFIYPRHPDDLNPDGSFKGKIVG